MNISLLHIPSETAFKLTSLASVWQNYVTKRAVYNSNVEWNEEEITEPGDTLLTELWGIISEAKMFISILFSTNQITFSEVQLITWNVSKLICQVLFLMKSLFKNL